MRVELRHLSGDRNQKQQVRNLKIRNMKREGKASG